MGTQKKGRDKMVLNWAHKKQVKIDVLEICYIFIFINLKFTWLFAYQPQFCRQLLIFANNLDPDQVWQNVRPDLDPKCLTLW